MLVGGNNYWKLSIVQPKIFHRTYRGFINDKCFTKQNTTWKFTYYKNAYSELWHICWSRIKTKLMHIPYKWMFPSKNPHSSSWRTTEEPKITFVMVVKIFIVLTVYIFFASNLTFQTAGRTISQTTKEVKVSDFD